MQNEPALLYKMLERTIELIERQVDIVSVVLLDPDPKGKSRSFLVKFFHTYSVFGFGFLFSYSLIKSSALIRRYSIEKLLRGKKIEILKPVADINNHDFLNKLQNLNLDICISLTANQIFKKNFMEKFRLGVINLHSADLPQYRGLMPNFWVLKNSEKQTAVTAFLVDEGIDSGPILHKEYINIEDKSLFKLIAKCKSIAPVCVSSALVKLINNSTELQHQDLSKGSYFSFPSRIDVVEFLKSGNRWL